jgi:flagellar assembly factor FliW
MPLVETKYFGSMSYAEESAIDFPQGLPAFEEEKRFVLIAPSESAPLVFLQSLGRASLCFVAFPILVVDQDYHLGIAPEDLKDLGLDTEVQPVLGLEVKVLVLVSLRDERLATANLMAPIVVNVKTRRAVQAIRRDTRYPHYHPLARNTAEETAAQTVC